MMQAMTALSLRLPIIMCLPVRFRFLMKSQYFTHRKSPLTREITRDPLMSAQQCFGADMLARYATIIGPWPMA
jgi:hypothetical protein